MISIPLRLALRAERSYIHGTDLYSATHAAFAEHFARTSFTHIRIRIGRFYRHPLALVMEEGDAARDWQCEVDGRLWSARWEELSPAIVLPRRPFDEIALARHVRFAEKAAVLTGNPGWEPIECAVFLVKMLHERLRPSGRGRRWIFSRLDLERSLLPSDLHGMSASLEAELGDSFTRTRLRGGGSAWVSSSSAPSRTVWLTEAEDEPGSLRRQSETPGAAGLPAGKGGLAGVRGRARAAGIAPLSR